MIRAIIVDDERKGRLTLRKLLEKNCPDFIIIGEADNITEAKKIIEISLPDVIFLDIEMRIGTGFDLLKEFDTPFFHIVFVTAHSNYAVKAFKYSAVDYLLKPVDTDDLKSAASKIRKLLIDGIVLRQKFQKQEGFLDLRIKSGMLKVAFDEIIHLEAVGSYTKIHMLKNVKQVLSVNLGIIEGKLNKKYFVRVHRSHILNITHIKKISRPNSIYAEMSDGSKVEVSRRNKVFLFDALKELEKR